WCGPCQEMKKEVYPSAAVKPFHDKFNWAYLDIDVDANLKLFESHKLESVPHLLFLDAGGKTIDQQEGGSSPKEFAKKLEKVLKKAVPAKTASTN
ncbi:MAG: thioredoxin family protein, partial [Prosthecobacter sp.]|nr:thioredoxin family protein [Prosthecobacter sp.]